MKCVGSPYDTGKAFDEELEPLYVTHGVKSVEKHKEKLETRNVTGVYYDETETILSSVFTA